MTSNKFTAILVFVITLLLHSNNNNIVKAQLSPIFYTNSCPLFPVTVRTQVLSALVGEPRIGASILRLFYLDCFVNGCDGSILLDDTSSFKGEQSANLNRSSAREFDVINNIKSAVEFVCPGVVSCADILALAARDSVVALGGPSWSVRFGRRDAKTANLTAANVNIPRPTSNLSQLISSFSAFGFTPREMVALSGAHTIGQSRCMNFRTRIYNDTNIDPVFAAQMRQNCPRTSGDGDGNLSPLDNRSPLVFDNNYFKNLIAKTGLLHSDQELFNGGSTDSIVRDYSNNPFSFLSDFTVAMEKMGSMNPLTGSSGEVRRVCGKTNTPRVFF